MIKAILIINNHGKPRLLRFYEYRPPDIEQKIVREIFQLVSKRTDRLCNFLEAGPEFGKDTKLIYRHYATLYFIFAVDPAESELAILDMIQVFVEALDKIFENVCELDLIFHSEKVYYLLDEIVQGGLVLETSLPDIVAAYKEQQKLEAADDPLQTIKNALENINIRAK